MAVSKFSIFDGRNRPLAPFRWSREPSPPSDSGGHGYDPHQPRVPKGNSDGGQWTNKPGDDGGGEADAAFDESNEATNRNDWPWFQFAAFKPRREQRLIRAHRREKAERDLFGRKPDPKNSTVAMTELNGKRIFGANSKHHSYTGADRSTATRTLETLIRKYPEDMNTGSVGRFPNNALFHAEATVLLRAANANGGTLRGKNLEVHVDRAMCDSCDTVLPLLIRELGSPTVTFVDHKGTRYQARGGERTLRKLED